MHAMVVRVSALVGAVGLDGGTALVDGEAKESSLHARLFLAVIIQVSNHFVFAHQFLHVRKIMIQLNRGMVDNWSNQDALQYVYHDTDFREILLR